VAYYGFDSLAIFWDGETSTEREGHMSESVALGLNGRDEFLASRE
jgi:hypothetical protein